MTDEHDETLSIDEMEIVSFKNALDELEKIRVFYEFMKNDLTPKVLDLSPTLDTHYAFQAFYLRSFYLTSTLIRLDQFSDIQST